MHTTPDPQPILDPKHLPAKPLPESDIRRQVVDRLFQALDEGVVPWATPYRKSGGARNALTGMPYSGVINQSMLELGRLQGGFAQHWWLTEAQAARLGGQLKAEQSKRGVPCITYFEKTAHARSDDGVAETIEADTGDATERSRQPRTWKQPIGFTLFNIAQFEDRGLAVTRGTRPDETMGAGRATDLEASAVTTDDGATFEARVAARLERFAPGGPRAAAEPTMDERWQLVEDAIRTQTGVTVQFGPHDPCYYPERHLAKMPPVASFESSFHYAWVYAHEVAGHGSEKHFGVENGRFGTQAYARGELRAHLTGAMVVAEAGLIEDTEVHRRFMAREADYLRGWLKPLRQDPAAFVSAAAAATKAMDFVIPDDVRRQLGLPVAADFKAILEEEAAARKERRQARREARAQREQERDTRSASREGQAPAPPKEPRLITDPDGTVRPMTRAERSAENKRAWREGRWGQGEPATTEPVICAVTTVPAVQPSAALRALQRSALPATETAASAPQTPAAPSSGSRDVEGSAVTGGTRSVPQRHSPVRHRGATR